MKTLLANRIARRGASGVVLACFILAVGLVFVAPQVVCGADVGTRFDLGNKLYEQGDFKGAATNYAGIIQSGQASPPVYFNLGNAFFKAGQIGRAILSYRYAKAMVARDPDILANLQFARNQVQGPTLAQSAAGRWLGKLTLNEWTVVCAAAVWVWLLLLTVPQWRPALKRTLRGWTLAGGIIAAVLCACLGTQYYRLQLQPKAVIVTAEAALHQAPLAGSPSMVTLHDGAEVRVLDRKDDWLQVSTDPRRIGWIQRDQLVVIKAE